MFFLPPNYSRLKKNLKLAVFRLDFLLEKKSLSHSKIRKDIMKWLKMGCDAEARVKTVFMITEAANTEALEIIRDHCYFLLAEFKQIQRTKKLDTNLAKAVTTILWCTPVLFPQIPELTVMAKELTIKYGTLFAYAATSRSLNTINEKLVEVLECKAPSEDLVDEYIMEMATSCRTAYLKHSSADEPGNLIHSAEEASEKVHVPFYDSDSSVSSFERNVKRSKKEETVSKSSGSCNSSEANILLLDKEDKRIEVLEFPDDKPSCSKTPDYKYHTFSAGNATRLNYKSTLKPDLSPISKSERANVVVFSEIPYERNCWDEPVKPKVKEMVEDKKIEEDNAPVPTKGRVIYVDV